MDLTNKNGGIKGISMGYSWNVHAIFHGVKLHALHLFPCFLFTVRHPTLLAQGGR